jgi:hypothetical protein
MNMPVLQTSPVAPTVSAQKPKGLKQLDQRLLFIVIGFLILLLPIVAMFAYNAGKSAVKQQTFTPTGELIVLPSPVSSNRPSGQDPSPPANAVCPTDVKTCNDGSSVIRMLPSCDFAPCP